MIDGAVVLHVMVFASRLLLVKWRIGVICAHGLHLIREERIDGFCAYERCAVVYEFWKLITIPDGIGRNFFAFRRIVHSYGIAEIERYGH